jgi:hypothetical protein
MTNTGIVGCESGMKKIHDFIDFNGVIIAVGGNLHD